MIDRFLQGTVATPTATFDVDAVNVAVTSPAVVVTRVSDGTVVVSGSATPTGNVGQVSIPLSAAQTALLDRLKLTWTATPPNGNPQTLVTYIDIVGGFLLGLPELKAVYPTKSTDELAFIRATAEDRLEDACNHAFVPRFQLERHAAARCRRGVRLAYRDVRALRSIVQTYGTTTYAWTAQQLAQTIVDGGVLEPFGWGLPVAWGTITIGYEHGDDVADNEASRVCLLVAQEEFPPGQAIDPRVIRQEADRNIVMYASPTSDKPFINPRINQFVSGFAPLVA